MGASTWMKLAMGVFFIIRIFPSFAFSADNPPSFSVETLSSSSKTEIGDLAGSPEGSEISSPSFSDFEGGQPPRIPAFVLTERLSPDARDTTWAITRFAFEFPYLIPSRNDGLTLSLRVKIPAVFEYVSAEARSFLGMGNVLMENWFSWDSYSDESVWVHGFGAGGIVPVGAIAGNGTHGWFQQVGETVPALGLYGCYALYRMGHSWDMAGEASIGAGYLQDSGVLYPIQTRLSGFVNKHVGEQLGLQLGGTVTTELASALLAARWHASGGFEVGVGLHIPFWRVREGEAVQLDEELPFQPQIELIWHPSSSLFYPER